MVRRYCIDLAHIWPLAPRKSMTGSNPAGNVVRSTF
jgi:hypothetical protein